MPLELRFPLRIAGSSIDVWAPAGLDLSFFDERARRFARPAGDPPDLRIDVRPRPDGEPAVPFEPPHGVLENGRVVVRGGGVRVTFDGARIDATLEPTQGGIPFENVLRFTISRHLLQHDGALMHAAALASDRGGFLFPGVSGAGKSTLTLRHPAPERLSEDLVAVRKYDGVWFVESLPFFAVNRLEVGPRRERLRAFAFLRQSSRVHANAMSRAECRRRLARSLVLFAPMGLDELALERVVELAAAVPAFDFEVDLTSPIWPELHAQLG